MSRFTENITRFKWQIGLQHSTQLCSSSGRARYQYKCMTDSRLTVKNLRLPGQRYSFRYTNV